MAGKLAVKLAQFLLGEQGRSNQPIIREGDKTFLQFDCITFGIGGPGEIKASFHYKGENMYEFMTPALLLPGNDFHLQGIEGRVEVTLDPA